MRWVARLKREWRYLTGLARTLARVRSIKPTSRNLICDDLEAAADRWRERPALSFEGAALTYGELDALANRYAHWALAQGIGRGETVALILPNRLEYLPIWYGLTKVGVAAALINNQLTGAALAHCLNISGAGHCLVDDQTLVRQGIRSLLELSDSIRVIGEAIDGAQAIETIPRLKPDVVLLDMRMPGMSGLDVLNALAAKKELPPTIILTTFDDDQLVLAGLKAGARGYLLKDVSLDQLVDAVKTVADGGSLVAPMVTQRLLSGLERMHNEFTSLDRPDPLTERETEILRLMAGGYSNKEIANSLGVAEGTVKNHVSNILSKLGVRDRTRAVLKAFELGIV